jgi:fatty-acyl-CoA synthase
VNLTAARVLAKAGVLRPIRPDRLVGMGLQLARWGVTPAAGYAVGAAAHPDRLAIIDDDGELTYRQVDERTDRLAGELRARGVQAGDAVGLLARNGRGFLEALVAASKCGADVLLLNTGSAAEQLTEVLRREKAVAVVHDHELGGLVEEPATDVRITTEELEELAESSAAVAPPKSGHKTRLVILTSGTTGAPRGAARSGASLDDAVSVLSRIPLRAGERTLISSPLFHAWGLGQLSMALVLGSTVVLQRRFEPERVLAGIGQHRPTGLVVVPVMLDRLLEADVSRYDTSSLRVIASSGSALPGDLATRVLESFGPVLYNLYGSTEVAYVAVATPEDLAADPRTAGQAPWGVRLRVVDEAGNDCPPGTDGRLFAGSGLTFEGYTDGSDKDRMDGLVATGDRGVLSADRRLTVLGRDVDMVVIGGENVFTGQVEDALLSHPRVQDAAVTSEDDPTYGTRLVAHVVAEADADELKAWVRDRLARFAVPREFRFLDELPRNATGKVLKQAL